jgi:hypothetical protein
VAKLLGEAVEDGLGLGGQSEATQPGNVRSPNDALSDRGR